MAVSHAAVPVVNRLSGSRTGACAVWHSFLAGNSPADGLGGRRGSGRIRRKTESEAALDPKLLIQRTRSIAAWTIVFALGFWLFGFKVGGLLLSPAFLRFQARETWKMSILYGLGVYLFFLGGFEMALGFPLPPGIIATSLGLQSFDWYAVNPMLNLILRR